MDLPVVKSGFLYLLLQTKNTIHGIYSNHLNNVWIYKIKYLEYLYKLEQIYLHLKLSTDGLEKILDQLNYLLKYFKLIIKDYLFYLKLTNNVLVYSLNTNQTTSYNLKEMKVTLKIKISEIIYVIFSENKREWTKKKCML